MRTSAAGRRRRAESRLDIVRGPVADKRAKQKSKYTLDRGIPGAFEGETITRRRFMTGTANGAGAIAAAAFTLPALGFAIGPIFKSTPHRWETVGHGRPVHRQQLHPGGHHAHPRHRRGRQDDRVRAQVQPRDRHRPATTADTPYIAISSRCAHVGCPVRWVDAAERFICPCHGGVYDLLGRRVGGPAACARSTASTRASIGEDVQVGPRFSVNSQLRRFSPRDPGEPLDGIGQYLYPSRPDARRNSRGPSDSVPKLPAPPLPSALKAPPPRPGESNGKGGPVEEAKEAGITVVDWVDERTSLSGAGRWLMFRKVPEGHQLVLHARLGDDVRVPLPGRHRRVPGDVLPPRPAGGAYESIRHVTNDVFLGQFVRGMHKWGSSVMVVLVFLHMGRTFFFGAYKYPRELNWVIGVVLLILTMVMALHRLPAAVRPARLLGDDRRRQHQRHRPADRPLSERLPARRLGIRRDDAVALLCHPHAARARALIAALIGAHLYLVTKLGTTAPPWLKAEKRHELREAEAVGRWPTTPARPAAAVR